MGSILLRTSRMLKPPNPTFPTKCSHSTKRAVAWKMGGCIAGEAQLLPRINPEMMMYGQRSGQGSPKARCVSKAKPPRIQAGLADERSTGREQTQAGEAKLGHQVSQCSRFPRGLLEDEVTFWAREPGTSPLDRLQRGITPRPCPANPPFPAVSIHTAVQYMPYCITNSECFSGPACSLWRPPFTCSLSTTIWAASGRGG